MWETLRRYRRPILLGLGGFALGALVAGGYLAVQAALAASDAVAEPTATAEPPSTPAPNRPSPAPEETVVSGPWPAPDTLATTDELMSYIEVHATSTIVERADPETAIQWAPLHKPAGYGFWSRAGWATGIRLSASGLAVQRDLTQLKATLADLGFTEFVLDPGEGLAPFRAEYESADLMCSISESGADGYSVVVACADKAAYLGPAHAAAPFFAVYAAESGDRSEEIILDPPLIEPSNTSGYAVAIASVALVAEREPVSGAGALFYQTPDGRWHYFTSVQSILNCDEYPAGDVRRAFAGSPGDEWRSVPGSQCLDRSTGELAPVTP